LALIRCDSNSGVPLRIALIAPPFIPVPPKVYGGTELFVAHLAEGLKARGIEAVVYTNGESTIDVERRWFYAQAQWPIQKEIFDNLTDFNHTFWAMRDAMDSCDLIHVNNVPGVLSSCFCSLPVVATIHHPHVPELSELYSYHQKLYYVTISDFQRACESMLHMRTIHHGIEMDDYSVSTGPRSYLAFLGRLAPLKGTHLAIQIAQSSGIPLKIAGEVQPAYKEYFEQEVAPHVDGKFIEFVGEVDLKGKNELLAGAIALLFPIQWNEPFGLVMIEAMACGAPVLALPGGSVPEVVREGISGHIRNSTEELVDCLRELKFDPRTVRAYAAEHFSVEVMAGKYLALYDEILGGEKDSADEIEPRAVA
jgi:glycosyltransferase involved in cell wall biosynthesis